MFAGFYCCVMLVGFGCCWVLVGLACLLVWLLMLVCYLGCLFSHVGLRFDDGLGVDCCLICVHFVMDGWFVCGLIVLIICFIFICDLFALYADC